MNEKEKEDFYIAMCKCCLVAKAMKTCSVCRFKIGLGEPIKLVVAKPSPVQVLMADVTSLGTDMLPVSA